ncbi:MAG: T9SS type A sorting domain-containing protein [Flavipsychrobacter sp.]
MKKFFTFLCFGFVAYCQKLDAQAIAPKLIANAYSSFGTTSGTKGTQYYGDSTQYFYTSARTYSVKKGWLADTAVGWYNGSTTWTGYHLQNRTINKYDDSGNQTILWSQRYNYTDTSWHNVTLDSLAYDNHNNLVYLAYENWDPASGDWQNSQQIIEQYSGTNNLLSSLSQHWDNTLGSWANDLRYHGIYSSSDDRLADSNLFWNSATSTWGNAAFSTINHYTYDSHHHSIKDTSWLWSVSNNAWLPRWVDDSISYNASDKMVYERAQHFDTSSMTWNETDIYKIVYDAAGNDLSDTVWVNGSPFFLGTFSYDAAGHRLSYNLSYWDKLAGKWKDSAEYDDTYDSRGNRIAEVTKIAAHGKSLTNQFRYLTAYNSYNEILTSNSYIWDTTAATWLHYDLNQYYYDSLLNVTSIRLPMQGQLSVYPVPAATMLTIDIKWPQVHAARLAIYDLNGRLYRQWETNASAIYHSGIPVADLPVGNYILVARAGDAVTTARFSICR